MIARTTSSLRTPILALAASAALSPYLLQAQQNGGAWTNIGPSPVGIIAPVVVDPRGGGSMFIGLFTDEEHPSECSPNQRFHGAAFASPSGQNIRIRRSL